MELHAICANGLLYLTHTRSHYINRLSNLHSLRRIRRTTTSTSPPILHIRPRSGGKLASAIRLIQLQPFLAHTGLYIVRRLLADGFETRTTTAWARTIAAAARSADGGSQPSENGEVEERCSVDGHAAADDARGHLEYHVDENVVRITYGGERPTFSYREMARSGFGASLTDGTVGHAYSDKPQQPSPKIKCLASIARLRD